MAMYKSSNYHHIAHMARQFEFDVVSPPKRGLFNLGYLFHEFGHACDYIVRNEEWRTAEPDFGFLFAPRSTTQNSIPSAIAGEIRAVAYSELLYKRFKPLHLDWSMGLLIPSIVAIAHMPCDPLKFSERVFQFKTRTDTKQAFELAVQRLKEIVSDHT